MTGGDTWRHSSQTDPRKPDHHRRFSETKRPTFSCLAMARRLSSASSPSPVPWLSTHPQGDLSRRRVPDPPLALCPCPSGWGHHLADPVHHVSVRCSRSCRTSSCAIARCARRSPAMPCWRPMAASVWSCARCSIISRPMALYRLVCAFGHQSLVTVLTRCGLPLPVVFPGR